MISVFILDLPFQTSQAAALGIYASVVWHRGKALGSESPKSWIPALLCLITGKTLPEPQFLPLSKGNDNGVWASQA